MKSDEILGDEAWRSRERGVAVREALLCERRCSGGVTKWMVACIEGGARVAASPALSATA